VKVRLLYASLPFPLGFVAVHFWFTVDGDRWEVWQTKNAGGTCVGHLHRNLKSPEADVGGGPARVAHEWDGAEASRLKEVLERAADEYPHCHRYAPWPGPNSNTFAAWVLCKAGIDFRLPWQAIGRSYRWREG
jgi:hypothetical protein